MDNYQLSRDRAQAYFLGFDQEDIIDCWHLRHDENWLYPVFFGNTYRVCRRTGTVFRCGDGCQADFSEVLSIFDLLCHQSESKFLSGVFAPVGSLKGVPRTGGVGTDFHRKAAARFDREPEKFRLACEKAGGTAVPMGDIGYQFPVFADLTVILKFYRSDEDFPAMVTLLWDENTLQYVFYETVFYMAGFLLGAIEQNM